MANVETRVTKEKAADAVRSFTQNGVMLKEIAADKLEIILKHYGTIPLNAHYAEFDIDDNCYVFRVLHGDIPYMTTAELEYELRRKYENVIRDLREDISRYETQLDDIRRILNN